MQKVSPAEAAALSVLYPTSPLPPQGIPIPQTRSLVTLPNLTESTAPPPESYPIYEPIDERGALPHRQNVTHNDSDGQHHQVIRGGYGDTRASHSTSPHTAVADRYYESEYASYRGSADATASTVERSDYFSYSSRSPNSEIHQLTVASPQLPLSRSSRSPPSSTADRAAVEGPYAEFVVTPELPKKPSRDSSLSNPNSTSPPPGTFFGSASASDPEFNSL